MREFQILVNETSPRIKLKFVSYPNLKFLFEFAELLDKIREPSLSFKLVIEYCVLPICKFAIGIVVPMPILEFVE